MRDINLPPLPNILGLTAAQIEQVLQTYVRDAVLADRAQRSDPVAVISYLDCDSTAATILPLGVVRFSLPAGTKLFAAPQPVEQRVDDSTLDGSNPNPPEWDPRA